MAHHRKYVTLFRAVGEDHSSGGQEWPHFNWQLCERPMTLNTRETKTRTHECHIPVKQHTFKVMYSCESRHTHIHYLHHVMFYNQLAMHFTTTKVIT